jgi:hypothetical protein
MEALHNLNFVSYGEQANRIGRGVFQLFKMNTAEEIENIMKAILPSFYSSLKLKSLPENYDTTQQNSVWIFRNFTNTDTGKWKHFII